MRLAKDTWHLPLGPLLLSAAVLTLAASAAAAPFTPIRKVRDLPRNVLATNPLVHVRGLITCANQQYQMVFVQDDTGGIFVYGFSPAVKLSPGDEVEIQAFAARGRFASILDSAQVTRVGKKALPNPPQVPIARVISGETDGERVETQAVVERAYRRGDHLWLHLASAGNSCAVAVPITDDATVPDLVDTRVSVRGVVASTFKKDILTGFQLFANDFHDLHVLERPEQNAFEAPICPAAELAQYRGRRAGEHRVHVRGVVSLHWPGRATVLEDETGGIFIENGATGELKPGDVVDVAAFPGPVGAVNRLRHAEIRVVAAGQEPKPIPAVMVNAATLENRLVRVVGRVVEWLPHRQGETLVVLSSGSDLFTAVLRDAGAERARALFESGAVVNLTGVMRAADNAPGARPSLWLRSAADVTLLQAGPASPWKWVIVTSAAAGGFVLAAVLALVTITARHRRATATMNVLHHNAEERLEEMERQFRRAHRDREFITQELHDNIVQSIFSVGLGIDEARRLLQKSPERVEDRLDVAVQALNKIIRDVRAFIGGLEPKGLNGDELKTALKSVLLASGENQEARFSLQIDASAARELTSMQATEVFNIAKEAMANAMRHSQARLTTVSLVPRGRGVRLEVADDGVGFEPNGTERGLGLRNIRSRARNIGAKLDIISAPGHGTRIVADIPISTHDDN